MEVILRVREEGGAFASLADFCQRVMGSETGSVSRGTMEALIQSGAFASLPGHTNRRALIEALDPCCQAAQRSQKDKKNGQASLSDMFGDDADVGPTVETIPIPNIPDYPSAQLLGFERDLLGLYISDHPLQAFMPRFEKARRNPRVRTAGKSGSDGSDDWRHYHEYQAVHVQKKRRTDGLLHFGRHDRNRCLHHVPVHIRHSGASAGKRQNCPARRAGQSPGTGARGR